MSDLNQIVDSLSKLTVLEVVELVKSLEEKWGVSAASVAVAASSEVKSSSVEEKNSFDVMLTSPGQNKVAVIKVIKDITALGLKESKDLTDNCPSVIKKSVAKAEAEEIKKKLEESGASVELK